MAERILVVGYSQDAQTAHQVNTLLHYGADVRVIPADLAGVRFSWNNDEVLIDKNLVGRVDAALIRALPPSYLGSVAFPEPLDWPSYFRQFCLQRDRSDTLLGFLFALESNHVPCWNSPSRSLLVRRKPYQLDVIRSLGCAVPETLLTNDPDQAIDFLKQYPDAIAKPAAGGALTLNAAELPVEQLQQIRTAPAIFQRRIRGDDVRVIAAGEKILSSVRILVPPDTIDFRGDQNYQQGKITYEEVHLPSNIETDCLRVCAALGYRYGGIDLKQIEDTQFVFLECNNSPIYLDVEKKMGHPITRILAEEILASARTK